MSSLQRYKKSGGFIQLLSLLETFGPQKREKFLEMIDQENQAWAKALRDKMLSLERIFQWPDQVIIEVFKSLPLKNMAIAINGLKEDQKAKIIGFFSASEQRKMSDALADGTVKPEESASNVVKVIELTRKMIVDGLIRPEKFDEGLLIAEDIEVKLESGAGTAALNFKAAEKMESGSSAAATAAQAAAEGAPASLEAAQLQRLLAQLSKENKVLKDEVKILREKLEQIKRIA